MSWAHDPTLRALLDEGARFDAEYGNRLSDHRPMALVALARLGADAARLREFAQHYEQDKGLRPARTAPAWPSAEPWTAHLGQREAWPAARAFFAAWIDRSGEAALLREALPALVPHCGGAAFHGLIRTAYAMQAQHRGELAAGLAHWAASALRLGPWPADMAPAPTGKARETERDPQVLLAHLPTAPPGGGLIHDRMAAAARDGTVTRAIATLVIDAGTPEALARAAASTYAATGNFTALHLVTGTHAMRIVATALEGDAARADAWRWFWQAFAHGVVAARLVPAARPLTLRPWPELVAAALAARDEHLVKLIDSCREEEHAHGGDDWRRAASRVLMT